MADSSPRLPVALANQASEVPQPSKLLAYHGFGVTVMASLSAAYAVPATANAPPPTSVAAATIAASDLLSTFIGLLSVPAIRLIPEKSAFASLSRPLCLIHDLRRLLLSAQPKCLRKHFDMSDFITKPSPSKQLQRPQTTHKVMSHSNCAGPIATNHICRSP